MRMYDIIDKKKKGKELSSKEIEYMVTGFVEGEIPDYQISALLMAIYFKGMSDSELLDLTNCMAKSGEMIDLSAVKGIKVDKHSTGGVGDKTTLVVAPLVAACGAKVAKMSGRGLGFTGGTIDKLESIPGFQTSISHIDFLEIVNKIGVSVIGQSEEVAPADKKMYALRDVTATIESIPLIAASIMSKKIAAGADKIVLDVTVGSGAFIKSQKEAILLAEKMVSIGEGAGRETVAYITNMDIPLGIAVGNNLEMIEAIHTLQGNGPEDFQKICILIATRMLSMAEIGSLPECEKMVRQALSKGEALNKLADMVKAQGGDTEYIYHTEKFASAKYRQDLVAWEDGCIESMDTARCGMTSVILGAGRETKESTIDFEAGILFHKKTGNEIKKGDIIATLYSSDQKKLQEGLVYLKKAYVIENKSRKEILKEIEQSGRQNPEKSVFCFVSKKGVEKISL